MRFKIFLGTLHDNADVKANIWLREHPEVVIVKMKYKMGSNHDHSICILYRTVNE